MKALIIHPNNDYNCGDLLTWLGAKSLLTQAAGGRDRLNICQFDMLRAEREPRYMMEYNFGELDVVALGGTPWLWINCEQTTKYRLVLEARQRFARAKFIGLGLGSMFERHVSEFLTQGAKRHFFNSERTCAVVRDLFRTFDLVVTRDCMARHIFEYLGVPVIDTYDTSIYAHHALGRGKCRGQRAVLFFYHAGRTNNGRYLDFPVSKYVNTQLEWAEQNNADILVNCPEDGEILTRSGIKFDIVVDIDYLAEKLGEYSKMLSGRVHMAVLGRLAGIPDITILPVDSRYLTATRLGAVPQFVGQPYEHPVDTLSFSWEDVDAEERKIVTLLKERLLK